MRPRIHRILGVGFEASTGVEDTPPDGSSKLSEAKFGRRSNISLHQMNQILFSADVHQSVILSSFCPQYQMFRSYVMRSPCIRAIRMSRAFPPPLLPHGTPVRKSLTALCNLIPSSWCCVKSAATHHVFCNAFSSYSVYALCRSSTNLTRASTLTEPEFVSH